MKRALALPLALAMTACAPSDLILLHIASSRDVPGEVDAVTVSLVDPEGQAELIEEKLELDRGFPIDVLFEPSGDTPKLLHALVIATRAGDEVSDVTFEFEWVEGKTSRVEIALP